MSKIKSILSKLKNIYFIFFALILCILSILNILKIHSRVYYIAGIVYLVILFFSSLLLIRIKNKAFFLISIVFISFLTRFAWILIANTEPVSDFYLLDYAAKLILEGNFSKLKEINYFSMWVYQLGFSVYSAFLYLLFGTNIFVVKIFNVIFSTGCVLLVYFISLKAFNEKAARISSVLYCIYIQSIIFNSLLTNQVISLFFIYLGLAIIFYKPNTTGYFLAGISIAVGHIMRPEGSFVLYLVIFVVLAYNIFNLLKNNKPFKVIKTQSLISLLSKIAVLIICFNIFIQLFGYSLKSFGITDYYYKNRNTYWKFVLGLNASTNGGYSNEDAKILDDYPIGDLLYEKELDLIKERLKDKKQLAKLMYRKFIIMWSDNDFSIQFISPGTKLSDKNLNYIVRLEKVQYSLVMLLSFLSILFILKDKNKYNLIIYMLTILISANWFIYLFIEIQTRYRFFIMPAFFILSGYGFYRIMLLVKQKHFLVAK